MRHLSMDVYFSYVKGKGKVLQVKVRRMLHASRMKLPKFKAQCLQGHFVHKIGREWRPRLKGTAHLYHAAPSHHRPNPPRCEAQRGRPLSGPRRHRHHHRGSHRWMAHAFRNNLSKRCGAWNEVTYRLSILGTPS